MQLDEGETEPRSLIVMAGGQVVGHVASAVYNEVVQLIELGLSLEVVLDHTTASLSVAIRLESRHVATRGTRLSSCEQGFATRPAASRCRTANIG